MLSVDGEDVELPAGAQRLVALVTLRGRMSRSRVAGTLWPETLEHRALASLRTGIWRVNQVADRLLASSAGTVDLGPGVDVDARRLAETAVIALGDPAAATAADLHAAADDGGELLPDWEDEWLLPDRERLRQIRLHVLEAIAEKLAVAGRYGLAIDAALAALQCDVLRESAHRTVIRIHLAEGNVNEARRAYDLCRQVLDREVGVEPTPATARMLASPL